MAFSDETVVPPMLASDKSLFRLGEFVLLCIGGIGVIASLLPFWAEQKMLVLSIGGSLFVLALMFIALRLIRYWRRRARIAGLADLVANDPAPVVGCDSEGWIFYKNTSALQRYPNAGWQVTEVFRGLFASPDAAIRRMQARAFTSGATHEIIVTRRGHLRLSVQKVGQCNFVWRVDELSAGADVAARALPRVILSTTGALLGMNPALRRLVGDRPRGVEDILTDLPLRPGEEHDLLTLNGPLRCFAAEPEVLPDRREIFLLPVAADKASSHDATAFEALPVPLMRLTPDGAVETVNAAARKLIGAVESGTRLSDIMEGLGRPVNDWVADACVGRTERRPEVLRLRSRTSEIFLQVTLNRMIEQGRMGLIAVLTDATQFKQLEAQFAQSQKMQAVGQLAGGVAHDFNNLLTAISGHCDLLMLRHDRAAPDFGDLEQIRQNANRAAALVRQLLAFSRKQTMNPEVLDLRDTLSDLTHLLNRLVGEKITLSLLHDPDLKPIRADKRQIEQVLMNLVVNARDAMPGGGEIRIETQTLLLKEDLQRDRACVPAGEYVRVVVTDEGMGIAADTLQKIFEPFFTTKRLGEGTGLGLSTAYGIVKQTGGYIFCDSTVGDGTAFSIFLPTHTAVDALQPAPVETTDCPASGSATILLVEDEAAVRAFASRALKLRGYTVFEADSGEDALNILADEGLHFDIFVTDVIMPGMDGPTWVSEALKLRPDAAVIFMSGYAEDAFRDGWPPITNSAFLPKPFSLGELAATVKKTLAHQVQNLS